ncbi:MAG: AraC family transcriptional regulator [Lachnospiraceae bacterium]|nr:AraC family transcriptional regulator [Lachnospiraceae bacterium]
MPYQIEIKTDSLITSQIHGLSTLPHLHTHLELIYLTEGSSIATVDYKDYRFEKGDISLSFPNQIHCYHDCEPVCGYMLIFSNDLFKELKEMFQTKVPSSPIIKKEQLPPRIRGSLEKILHNNQADSYFEKITARGYFLGLLGELLPAMTLSQKSSSHDSIKSILTYCSDKYLEPLSLDTLAEDLHLNKYYISHIFKERMGISFTDFINALRVEHACSLLEEHSDMTEIAFSSGFSSIRTFNRAFAKSMGMPPREYLKAREAQTGFL